MIVIIQCASTKKADAPLFRDGTGKRILFVGRPELAPISEDLLYARPDDQSDKHDLTWRQQLEDYNARQENPLGLARAYQLYTPPAYEKLVSSFGVRNVYILSAG